MTTHLSTRLVWHDRGWDGHICDHPSKNAYCILHKHVRKGRDDDREDEAAGRFLDDLDGWQPPCSRDPIAFSARGYTITHQDPLDSRRLPSTSEGIPPYSVCPSPYRWLREEHFRMVCETERLNIPGPPNVDRKLGWVYEPGRQIALLQGFWSKLEAGRSLIFFYCDQGNPLDENLSRILLGVGRISNVGSQIYFRKKPPHYPDRYPIWSRCITHDFVNQGFRLPYHEYLHAGHDPSTILCRVPDGAMVNFSYVAEHLADDVAVGALERLIQSVQIVKDEDKVAGEWDRHLVWLNDVLSEVWTNRGPFPGTGSVLQFLGFESGTAFQRQVLNPVLAKGRNAWKDLVAVLEGGPCLDRWYKEGLKQASDRWRAYKQPVRDLLALLARFELTPEQVRRVGNADDRQKAGISASEDQILGNPYLLSEMDKGGRESEPIALEVIDRGMRPEGDAARFLDAGEICAQDDHRRVRGVAVAVLQGAAEQGDTLLPFAETLTRIVKRLPERRACRPDRNLIEGQAAFYQESVDFRADADPPTMALKWLAELEQEVARSLERKLKRGPLPSPKEGWSWEVLLKQEFGGTSGSKLPPEVEERARKEKAEALHDALPVPVQRAQRAGGYWQDLGAEGLPERDGAARWQAADPAARTHRQGPCAAHGAHQAGR